MLRSPLYIPSEKVSDTGMNHGEERCLDFVVGVRAEV